MSESRSLAEQLSRRVAAAKGGSVGRSVEMRPEVDLTSTDVWHGQWSDALAMDDEIPDASELAAQVRNLLPWQSRTTGKPVQMDVVKHGFLDVDNALFSAGTPFVVVVVESWDAADAVRDALEEVARLDDAAWAMDWTRSAHGFREIQIFLDQDAF